MLKVGLAKIWGTSNLNQPMVLMEPYLFICTVLYIYYLGLFSASVAICKSSCRQFLERLDMGTYHINVEYNYSSRKKIGCYGKRKPKF